MRLPKGVRRRNGAQTVAATIVHTRRLSVNVVCDPFGFLRNFIVQAAGPRVVACRDSAHDAVTVFGGFDFDSVNNRRGRARSAHIG